MPILRNEPKKFFVFSVTSQFRIPADEAFDWEEVTDFNAQREWRGNRAGSFRAYAEEHAISRLATQPHCPAVVFLGVVDGEHRCRPADEADLEDKPGATASPADRC